MVLASCTCQIWCLLLAPVRIWCLLLAPVTICSVFFLPTALTCLMSSVRIWGLLLARLTLGVCTGPSVVFLLVIYDRLVNLMFLFVRL